MGIFNFLKQFSTTTEVSGCRTIRGVKNLNKPTLFFLQVLVAPGSRRRALSTKQIIAACDSILTNCVRITDDCKKIIGTTENPKVFYERYDLLLEKYSEMAKFEPYLDIYGYQPTESLTYYQSVKNDFEKKLINRCYNKALTKAESLKTEKGKQNQFVKVYESLLHFADSMNPYNKRYMDKKFEKYISPN